MPDDQPINVYAIFMAHHAATGGTNALSKAWGVSPTLISLYVKQRRPLPAWALERLGLERVVTIRFRYIDEPSHPASTCAMAEQEGLSSWIE
jgi:hypothetical protein